MKKLLVMMLAFLLILCAAGCGSIGGTTPEEEPVVRDGDTIGTGSKTFAAQIVDLDGNEISFTVKTDKTIVGEALQELGVLKGEEGPYGLYIKAVNGKTLDYEKDGAYWAFYVDGAYATAGVDETDIVETSVYLLKAEKG